MLGKTHSTKRNSIVAVPIFWRIIFGYSAILILSVGLSLYSIFQLGRLSDTVKTALNVDNRMIASEEKLTDAILSELRYGSKFIITHASTLLDEFRQFKKDSIEYLSELNTLAQSPDTKARLARVREYHLRYHDLFDQEIKFLNARQTYAETRYREEKEKIVERILSELQNLKLELQRNSQRKLEKIEKAARLARTITILITLLFLAIGVALSVAISRSIIKPISAMRRITADDAEGDSDLSLEFSHIPEIQELADALSKARRKVQETAKMNAELYFSMTEQFATPLSSIGERLRHLRGELAEVVTAEQRRKLDIVAEESDRLIRLFRERTEPSRASFKTGEAEDQKPARSLDKTNMEARTLERWVSHFVDKIGMLVDAGVLSRMADSWNVIKHSIAALRYGKAKK